MENENSTPSFICFYFLFLYDGIYQSTQIARLQSVGAVFLAKCINATI